MPNFCVVGSGPAAFYTAKFLFRKWPQINIDMIEKLPLPYGLVRFGVAPDHPEVKNVINDFEKVALNPNFRFFGNVSLGDDISVKQLRKLYDATILAYGAANEKKLNIEGENLKGIYSSKEFVGWYNGHPEIHKNFQNLLISKFHTQTAAIIGNGNVALDCARILTLDKNKLATTDIIKSAHKCISQFNFNYIYIIGRRGWPQASFTNKELRELLTEDSILPILSPQDFQDDLTEENLQEINSSRALKRSQLIFEKMTKNWEERLTTSKNIIHFKFHKSPVNFYSSTTNKDIVDGIKLSHMKLIGPAHSQKNIYTNEISNLHSSLIIKSIGYQCNFYDDIPNYNSFLIHNNGQIFTSDKFNKLGALYASGWLKRGPNGNIATNVLDSQETVQQIIKDFEGEEITKKNQILFPLFDNKNIVISFDDWLKIQKEEKRRGKEEGKIASKFTSKKELLEFCKNF